MKYISMNEYLMGRIKLQDLPPEYQANVNTLIPKINELLERFGEYRKCNSGFRTIEDQKRINPKSMKSNHLTCSAIDLSDVDGKLNKWMKSNPKVIEELDIYMEERQGGWQHIQIVKPHSGNRWFNP
jgi:hypothetical protein